MSSRREEWHITVEGDPYHWRKMCRVAGIKPLYIELSTFERQLMCAAKEDITKLPYAVEPSLKIVRVKHEVEFLGPGETALYWECHVKLEGSDPAHMMRFGAGRISRDLFRDTRYYATRRIARAFNPTLFVAECEAMCKFYGDAKVVGFEYEACLVDTNPGLDKNWMPECSV